MPISILKAPNNSLSNTGNSNPPLVTDNLNKNAKIKKIRRVRFAEDTIFQKKENTERSMHGRDIRPDRDCCSVFGNFLIGLMTLLFIGIGGGVTYALVSS